MPDSLRGTSLRKHIATYTSLLNVEDATVDTLANFMGHHKDIHKSIYRVSVPVAEVTCISKILMSAIGDVDDENEEHDAISDADDNDAESESEQNTSFLPAQKRRSTSPYGKTKRLKWTQQEREALYSTFGDLKALEKLPSIMQCFDAIKANPALKRRTPEQVKSWIDNQRRYK